MGVCGTVALASDDSRFSIEDALQLRSLAWLEAPALSPDGRYVAYLISYLGPDSRAAGRHQELWLTDTKNRQSTLIKDEALECSKPTWSPDGKRLAFYDKVGAASGIRVWSLETRNIKLAASDIERGALLPWSPDGRFVFARRVTKPSTPADATNPEEPAKQGIVVYRSQKNAARTRAYYTSPDIESSIVAFDATSGAEKIIVRRKKMDSFALSPNGRFIAWRENERAFSAPESYSLDDIGIVSLSSGAGRIVARDFRNLFDVYGSALAWSLDGNTLGVASLPPHAMGHTAVYSAVDARSGAMRPVFTSTHPQSDRRESILQWVNTRQFVVKEGARGRELWVVSLDGRKPYRLYQSPAGDIRGTVRGAAPWELWHPKPNTIALLIRRDSDLSAVPVWVNYKTRAASELPGMSRFTLPTVWPPHGVDSAGAAVVVMEDPTHPQDLWRMTADGALEQLTQLNPGISGKKLGNIRLLEWEEQGRPKRAVLLLPADYVAGEAYPTIVSQYSGIQASAGLFRFGLEVADSINQQIYASHGYAALVPDIDLPALPKDIVAQGQGSYPSERPNALEAIARQVNAAVDYAVQQGFVDPERLGITGTSNGGYGVMCTIVSTPRFKAAIARATVVDQMSMSWDFTNGTGDWGSMAEAGYGASLWQDRDLYINNSPFYFLDKVSTPLLLTRGTADDTVTTQPRQAYIGMKQLGKDVTLVEYEGEGHTDHDWSYVHRKDLLERMLRFFDEHLKSLQPLPALPHPP